MPIVLKEIDTPLALQSVHADPIASCVIVVPVVGLEVVGVGVIVGVGSGETPGADVIEGVGVIVGVGSGEIPGSIVMVGVEVFVGV